MCDNSTAYEVLNIKNIYITMKKIAEKTIQPPAQQAKVASNNEFSYKEFNLEPHFKYIVTRLRVTSSDDFRRDKRRPKRTLWVISVAHRIIELVIHLRESNYVITLNCIQHTFN